MRIRCSFSVQMHVYRMYDGSCVACSCSLLHWATSVTGELSLSVIYLFLEISQRRTSLIFLQYSVQVCHIKMLLASWGVMLYAGLGTLVGVNRWYVAFGQSACSLKSSSSLSLIAFVFYGQLQCPGSLSWSGPRNCQELAWVWPSIMTDWLELLKIRTMGNNFPPPQITKKPKSKNLLFKQWE